MHHSAAPFKEFGQPTEFSLAWQPDAHMPAWEPCLEQPKLIRFDFGPISEWPSSKHPLSLELQPSVILKPSGAGQYESTTSDLSATTCTIDELAIVEETKQARAVIVAKRTQIQSTRVVPTIRAPGKIAKPPRKEVKKEVMQKLMSRQAQKQPSSK